jgi:hypothetical protein
MLFGRVMFGMFFIGDKSFSDNNETTCEAAKLKQRQIDLERQKV